MLASLTSNKGYVLVSKEHSIDNSADENINFYF